MPTFHVKARKTSPLTYLAIEALTREDAIAQAVAEAAPGEQVEVLDCVEAGPGDELPVAPTGTTGVTGTAARR